jgi:hypothetical protein
MTKRRRRIGASQMGALVGGLVGIVMLVLALGAHGAAAQTAPANPAQVTVPASSHGGVTTTPRSSVTSVPKTTAPTHVPAPVAVTQPYVAQAVPTTTVAPTTVAPTTTTTIAGIGDRFTPGPVTLPLQTKGSNGHVDPTLAWLSGVGFALGLLIILGRLVVTRPRGRDRAPLA